jgi:Mg2+-importing ATPase
MDEKYRRSGGGFSAMRIFFRQFTSPIVLILIIASFLSLFLGDRTDGVIILVIVAVSGILGFRQEYSAASTVEALLGTVVSRARVIRDGAEASVPVDRVVPGDLVLLSAGSGIPGDARLIEGRDLFVNEAAITGETYPVEKAPGDLGPEAPLTKRTNALFMGSHVVRRFGYFLAEVTFLMLLCVFALNTYFDRPALESFLFALALAVGLTPQLLPAVISVNLSKGARDMAKRRVIVKRLSAIENFGSMDILCSDKTGTLTEGKIRIHSAVDFSGAPSGQVFMYAGLNASFQNGFRNPIDEALAGELGEDAARGWSKLDEIPYDFLRKRLSVLLAKDGKGLIITKGALENVLSVCSSVEGAGSLEAGAAAVRSLFARLSSDGLRVLGVAVRERPLEGASISRSDETDMVFVGLIALYDPPRDGIAGTVLELGRLGVALKMITGDNRLVAERVAGAVGIKKSEALTGSEIRLLSDDALRVRAVSADIFAEIEPNQKERIVRALKKAGHVVGYMGDGINDAPALHGADVGISVQGAADAAREAASIVLLERDLDVLKEGILDGRRVFANTMKYVFMAASANFGNMLSMAVASLFLPFLPLLPKQILLTNILTDLPELVIAADNVDGEWLEAPRRWSIGFLRRFMVVFGLVSSFFDCCTFAVLIWFLSAGQALFHTGWFVESVVSAALVGLVVRTGESIFKSRPAAAFGAAVLAAALPYTPPGRLFGFVPLPPFFMAVMMAIVAGYAAAAEVVKGLFYAAERRGSKKAGG